MKSKNRKKAKLRAGRNVTCDTSQGSYPMIDLEEFHQQVQSTYEFKVIDLAIRRDGQLDKIGR